MPLTPELADTIVEDLAAGKPLRQICREQSVSKSSVYDWIEQDEEFAGRIAHARARGYDQIGEECMEIADDQDEDPASRRVRIETRLKLLAKWDPKRYGDRQHIEHSGSMTDATTDDLAKRLDALTGKG